MKVLIGLVGIIFRDEGADDARDSAAAGQAQSDPDRVFSQGQRGTKGGDNLRTVNPSSS